MKKAISIILLFIIFIIIYFLQLNFFNWFTIAGVKPNLFVLLVLFIGLYSGARMGTALRINFWVYHRLCRKYNNWRLRNSLRNNWIFAEDI